MDERLLTAKDVADYLKIPEASVKKLVESGELSGYKIGGTLLRFKREHIEAYKDLAASKEPSTRTVAESAEEKRGFGRTAEKRTGNHLSYTAAEKIFDFLYYNDFYIASLVLLVFIIAAIL